MPLTIGAVGEQGAWAIGRKGTIVVLFTTAVLMVAPIPTFSSKMLKMDRDDTFLRSRSTVPGLIGFLKLVGAMLFCYLLYRFPFETVLGMNLVHLLSIPVGAFVFYRYASESDDKNT